MFFNCHSLLTWSKRFSFSFQEAETFAKEQNLDVDVKNCSEIALSIAALPKENKRRNRIVIITQGKDDVIVAQGECLRSAVEMFKLISFNLKMVRSPAILRSLYQAKRSSTLMELVMRLLAVCFKNELILWTC